MIYNKLTTTEFEQIILSIIRLNESTIKKNLIYSKMHYQNANLSITNEGFIEPNSTGIQTWYKGFEVKINRLDNDTFNDFNYGNSISFYKNINFLDQWNFGFTKIYNSIYKICNREIQNFSFDQIFINKSKFMFGDDVQVYFQRGFKNLEWSQLNKISPLILSRTERNGKLIIDFYFNSKCYYKVEDQTIIKDNWIEIISNYHIR